MQIAPSPRLLAALLGPSFLIAPAVAQVVPAQPAPAGEAVTLDQLSVEGPQGDNVGYLTKRTRSATKTDTPLIDTPQSVTVVTQRADPGPGLPEPHRGSSATCRASSRTRARATATTSSSAASARTPTSSSTASATTCSTSAISTTSQRIEVLKGPNALIFGRGGGGGIINRVLKEADGVPRPRDRGSAAASSATSASRRCRRPDQRQRRSSASTASSRTPAPTASSSTCTATASTRR